MSRRYVDPEPCTITPEDVAEFLERHGRPRAASMVRHLAGNAERAAKLYGKLASDYGAMYERLLKYEPRSTREPCTGVPPPESSD